MIYDKYTNFIDTKKEIVNFIYLCDYPVHTKMNTYTRKLAETDNII
jgi:hypothetical protein